MFLAIRDLKGAAGRFALVGGVVTLVTLLVVLLSGLTGGLAADSVGAIRTAGADAWIVGTHDGTAPSFAASSIPSATAATVAAEPGVAAATPIGISQSRVTAAAKTIPVSVFGIDPTGFAAPTPTSGTALADRPDGVVVSDALAANDGIAVGDTITVGADPTPRTVTGVAAKTGYAHTPVVWVDLATYAAATAQPAGSTATVSTIAVRTTPGAATPAAPAGTTVLTGSAATDAVPGFSSENGSLMMIQGFLVVISALVVGAFFTVWTLQRTTDIAILKAIGAANRYLLKDALGQAAVILALAGIVAAALGAGIGVLAAGSVPFVVSATTTIAPAVLTLVVGLVGAAVAVRAVTAVDPLSALGSAR